MSRSAIENKKNDKKRTYSSSDERGKLRRAVFGNLFEGKKKKLK